MIESSVYLLHQCRRVAFGKLAARLLAVLLLVATALPLTAQDAEYASREEAIATDAYIAGEKLYKGNCASCHLINKKLIGPALAGVYDKYEREWLYKWIKNSQALIKSGDERAIAIYEEYNQSVMTAFPTLKDSDIDNILTYIKVETDFPDVSSTAQEVVNAEGEGVAIVDEGWTPTRIFLAIITAILLVIAFVLTRLVASMDNIVREREGRPQAKPVTLGRIVNNRAFRIAATLLLFGLLSYTTYENAVSLGYQQGYQPTQPIKFSHKLHAGQWQIECQYCHSGAYHGKSAVIPSTNICMNCHKQIKEGPQYGTEEIAKIYASIGWDPETEKYIEGYDQKPVEWVRIHNLPDHVYFNHAQHVNAGQLECQTCHGEIQNMEVVYQENNLGMGWCMDCHRNQNVKFTSNDYYLHHYEKLHKAIKDGEVSTVTVEDVGGTECQKCHY